MSNTNETPTPVVSADEDFNSYERRYYGLQTEEPSDAPAVEPDAETAPESETGKEATEQPAEEKKADSEEEDEPEPKKDGKRGVERRISKLVRERDELRRQLAEKQAAEKPASETAVAKPAAPAAPDSDKPKLENFSSLEEYTEAVIDWREAKRSAEAQQKALVAQWNERQAKAREQHPDYDEVLEDVADIGVPPALQRVILDSEVGPEIAYALAGDKKELARIVQLDPLAAAREIGRLEAKLSAAAAAPKQTKSVSKAPTPIKPVSGGKAAPTPSIYDESLDYNAWEKVRIAQLRKRAA